MSKTIKELADEFYLTEDDIALLRSLVFEGVAKTNREIESLTKLQKNFS